MLHVWPRHPPRMLGLLLELERGAALPLVGDPLLRTGRPLPKIGGLLLGVALHWVVHLWRKHKGFRYTMSRSTTARKIVETRA